MGGWRSKFVLFLVVYFLGFATAIYFLAPVSEDYAADSGQKGFVDSALKSNDFAISLNTGLHKCVDFVIVAVKDLGDFIKQKVSGTTTSG
jgi:hypothetical protein